MTKPTKIMDQDTVRRAIARIAHEILEKNKGVKNLCLVGIRTRGAVLAERIREYIREVEKKDVPVGILDITLYRDDLTSVAVQPIVRETLIDFDMTGKTMVLIDDVLYTGRTIRSALNAIHDFGRPAQIQLAVMIDRGHRELPIRADYVGKNVPTSANQNVQVLLKESDETEDGVVIETRAKS